MSDESMDNSALEANGPPPVDHQKGTPHNIPARFASDPELKEIYDRTVADKLNAQKNFQAAEQELRKTQQKLTQLQQEKEAAERAKLEEQGKYKEIAEAEAARARNLEERLFKVEVQSHLDRALHEYEAVDSEFLSTGIMAKYGEELKANPATAKDLVARLKEEKPLLFKSQPVQQTAQQPLTKPTGQAVSTPQSGVAPSRPDFTAKRGGKYEVPTHEIEAAFDAAMNQL